MYPYHLYLLCVLPPMFS